MFDKAKIQTSLSGLVGWKQPTNPAYDIVSAGNLITRSARVVNENPLCKIEYIKDTYDYDAVSDADFNTFLTSILSDAAGQVCDSVFNESDYIDRNLLYQNAMNKVNLETLPSGFVGYQLEKEELINTAFKITRVICEFSGTGSLTLALFSSQNSAPVQTKVVAITSNRQEVVLNWVIDNTSGYSECEWYLGYLTTGLTITPFKRDYKEALIKSDIQLMEIQSIQVDGVSSLVLWDLLNVKYSSNTWGLNPDITVYKDYTDLIIQNESLFATAIQIQAQIISLENINATLQSNSNERRTREIIIEIEGINVEDGIKKIGLKSLLHNQIAQIRKQINKLKNDYNPNALETFTTI